MNIIPLKAHSRYFRDALRKNDWDLKNALGELIDNSIDAGASTITILQGGSSKNWEFTIKDDGAGMSPELLNESVDLGSDLLEYSETDIGEYGVGLTAAIFNITHSGVARIDSVCNGVKSSIEIYLDKVAKSEVKTEKTSESNGTTIFLPNHSTTVKDSFVKKYLGAIYFPAYSNNKNFKIIYDKVDCNDFNEITFTDPFYRDLKPSLRKGIDKVSEEFNFLGTKLKLVGYHFSKREFTNPGLFDKKGEGFSFREGNGGLYVKVLNRYLNLGNNFFPGSSSVAGRNRFRVELEILDKGLSTHFTQSNKNSVGINKDDDKFKTLIESMKKLLKRLTELYTDKPSDNITKSTQEMFDRISRKLAPLVKKLEKKDSVGLKAKNTPGSPIHLGGTKHRPSGLKYIKNLFNFEITGRELIHDYYFDFEKLFEGKLFYNSSHAIGQTLNGLQSEESAEKVATAIFTDMLCFAISLKNIESDLPKEAISLLLQEKSDQLQIAYQS